MAAIVATDWTVDRATGNIRYTGDDHNGAAPSYSEVIEFHRWLGGLADDAVYVAPSGDEIDITDDTPSERSTDNIIKLINGYNVDATAIEHLFDGTIIQGTGGTEETWDGIVNYGNPQVQIQIVQDGAVIADDWWNYRTGGTVTATSAVLTDSGASWTTDEWVGYTIYNATDGSSGVCTENDATTITATLEGGTLDTWTSSDAYLIGAGVNPAPASGISHRFMIKVQSAGASIDGRKLLGLSRRFGYSYSEFSINGTNNGNNTLALGDSVDLNNSTALSTVEGWSNITNVTAGYANIDVNNDSTDEYFYSEWNRDNKSINDLFERLKYLTRQGETTTLYGLPGEMFRGITHEMDISSGTGTWAGAEELQWNGGNSSGQLLAVDNTTGSSVTKVWIQLLTGSAPGDTDVLTGQSSSATATVTGAATERPISAPFCGVSTGSALIGGYGVGVEAADLSNSDLLTALDAVTYQPPNNVTFTVEGLTIGDRVLVTTDNSGIDVGQYTLNGALTGATVTSVVVTGPIESETPATGTIRIQRNNGQYSRHPYSGWTGSTFTITSADFSGTGDVDNDGAGDGNNCYNSYIDVATAGTSESFTYVYSNTPRTLFIRVRDGGASPIKTFDTTGTMSGAGGSTTLIRTDDA